MSARAPLVSIDDLLGEISSSASCEGEAWLLLGEAGIGKTTLCKHIAYRLCDEALRQRPRFIPQYVHLGGFGSPDDACQTPLIDHRVLAMAHALQVRPLLILDGWNELRSDRIRDAQLLVASAIDRRLAVVVTSRPLAAPDEMFPQRNVGLHVFQMQRWTESQLDDYFSRRGYRDALSRMPNDARACLRLPLLASLLIERVTATSSLPSVRTVSDVFDLVVSHRLTALNTSTDPDHTAPAMHWRQQRACLAELAHRMTQEGVVQTMGAGLEAAIPLGHRGDFALFVTRVIDTGLVRCVAPVAAVDPRSNAPALRDLHIAFLHQSLQEYLTAEHLTADPVPADSANGCPKAPLPENVSHNAFWREVPIYMIHLCRDSAARRAFASRFIDSGDFLTAARLASAVDDIGLARSLQRAVTSRLMENIAEQKLYAYSIETFRELGQEGQERLLRTIQGEDVKSVFAKAEAHLLSRDAHRAQEGAWRRLGRSVYILGELGGIEVVDVLRRRVSTVLSLHLLYHIGEALLTLLRRDSSVGLHSRLFAEAGEDLYKLARGDEITRAFAAAIIRASQGRPSVMAEADLEAFLRRQSDLSRPHFLDEFWKRAHGIEAFAEVSSPQTCAEIALLTFNCEELADYSSHDEEGYLQVQSSILKSALRSCFRAPDCRHYWRRLLEAAFQSERVARNPWACRHMEHLLVHSFTSPADVEWIRKWATSESATRQLRTAMWNAVWNSG
jgi:hypothetical protein